MALPTRAVATALVTAFAAFAAAPAPAAVLVPQAGWSWGSPSPQGLDLSVLDFAEGRGYATGALGSIIRSDDGGATWSGLPDWETLPLGGIERMRVIDRDRVVILGNDGCFLRRTDEGGRTWPLLFTPISFGCSEPVRAMT